MGRDNQRQYLARMKKLRAAYVPVPIFPARDLKITISRVSDPHAFHADPDPDPGLRMWIRIQDVKKLRIRIHVFFFTKNLCLFTSKKQKRTLYPDQNVDPDPDPDPETQENVDPDPGTPKLRIQFGSVAETLTISFIPI